MTEKRDREVELLLASPLFNNLIADIKERKITDDSRLVKVVANELIMNPKLKLSPRWVDSLVRYIRSDDKNDLKPSVNNVTVEYILNDKTGLYEIKLTVENKTGTRDIKSAWKVVELFQHKDIAKKKQYLSSGYDKQKRAYELKQEKMSAKEIAQLLSSEFNETIMYYEVSKLIQGYKKLLKG